MAEVIKRVQLPWSKEKIKVASVCAGGGLDIVAATLAGMQISFAVEIVPEKRQVLEMITDKVCLSDMFRLAPERLPPTNHLKIGPDCIDWARCGLLPQVTSVHRCGIVSCCVVLFSC